LRIKEQETHLTLQEHDDDDEEDDDEFLEHFWVLCKYLCNPYIFYIWAFVAFIT